ncbi:hydantoinase B/oxoprolinase family protein [Acuticoccus mangrovi]|uniref:Hydantoinase B/oxoprolinase family protein n=1 Tax=Acuticoccus mangrovi TaxID=2796142 RepID=A0A934MGY9_9HYPH|nr:hydantoinase B/oxoprolinase family protein [Acuticoccus mangrovi]
MTDSDIDLVTLEIIQEYFVSTVREMRVTMIRTAHSSIIYEGHDFSCALLDASGNLVAQSEDSPAHILPLPWQVREARAFFGGDLHPGDVILVNDPYTSGTHMNDVAMIVPHFCGDDLLGFICTRAHWGDVGGMTPGSISGEATEFHQEGLRIPFVKVHERGKPVDALLRLIFSNVRVPDEREGDFFAMLSCCNTAATRLDQLVSRFTFPAVTAVMRGLIDRAERRMRSAITAITPGTYYYEDYMDADLRTGNPVLLRVAITVDGDTLSIDFAGSSPQLAGPTNGSLAVAAMGSFVALKALLDPEGPINHGAFVPITVAAPEGSIVNVKPPGATGGYTEIRRRVESVVMGALARAVPRYVSGDIKGASNHTYIGSYNRARDRQTIFYEYPAGGTGGYNGHDGHHTLRAYDEGDFASIQPVESVEIEHALLVEACTLRPDSCGDGTYRGGLGMHREVRLLADEGKFSELSDRNILPPYGVCAGYAAAPNNFYVVRGEEVISPSPIPGKISGFPMVKGDIAVLQSGGGGGYGSPLERPVDKVLADLHEGIITEARAAERYGVIVRDGVLDAAATAEARAAGATGDRGLVVAGGEDTFRDGRRILRLSPATTDALGGSGALVEIVSDTGAPLRAWLEATDDVADDEVPLGTIARAILALDVGGTSRIRPLPGARPG